VQIKLMRATETAFHRLAESLGQLVWVVDPGGCLAYGNSAWYASTAIGAGARFLESYLPALHPEDRPLWTQVWEQAVRSGEPYAVERRIRFTSEGDYVSQLEWGNPLQEHGVCTGEWIITATDASENERLISQLRRQIEGKDRFLAVLAHEMRGPLAPIANALQVLQHVSGQPIISRTSAILTRQVAQLVRLVDDLFDLACAQNAQIPMQRAPVELQSAVAAAVEEAQPMITSRQQQLIINSGLPDMLVDGDSGRLTQVFANLLINATKFTPEGGRIWLSVEQDAGWFLVKVRDSGIGITRDMLGRVFDAYVQADGGKGGLGLGLALARQLVELHGGTIDAFSDGPGCGSEFVVRLPASSSKRAE
jgi:signal transduction histidine kinase